MKRSFLKGIFSAILLFPAAYLLIYSVSQNWVYPYLAPVISTYNWVAVFQGKSALFQSFILSLFLSFSIGLFSTMLAFFTSRYLFLARNAEFWKKLAILPFIISPIIYAISVNFFFNYFQISATIVGVSIAQIFIVYPYAMLLFSGFWNVNHQNKQQLVATLGGNLFLQWKAGIWPEAKWVFYTCLFQSFLISWFDFGFTQYIGLGKVKTLPIQVYQLIAEGNPYFAAVASALLLLPPILLLLVNRAFILKKV